MKQKKILLVEDNRDDETLMLQALRKSGNGGDVVVMRDGQAALDYLFAHAERDRDDLPSVVYLDLKLPKLDGLEVLQRIRAERRTKLQPVVVFTSSDEPKDRLKSYDCGANSYVCKPLDSTEYNETVHRMDSYWTRINRTPKD